MSLSFYFWYVYIYYLKHWYYYLLLYILFSHSILFANIKLDAREIKYMPYALISLTLDLVETFQDLIQDKVYLKMNSRPFRFPQRPPRKQNLLKSIQRYTELKIKIAFSQTVFFNFFMGVEKKTITRLKLFLKYLWKPHLYLTTDFLNWK